MLRMRVGYLQRFTSSMLPHCSWIGCVAIATIGKRATIGDRDSIFDIITGHLMFTRLLAIHAFRSSHRSMIIYHLCLVIHEFPLYRGNSYYSSRQKCAVEFHEPVVWIIKLVVIHIFVWIVEHVSSACELYVVRYHRVFHCGMCILSYKRLFFSTE